MDYQAIRLRVAGDVATLTLNRPDVMNAMNTLMRAEILHAVKAVADGARVLVITGAGRAFCAGLDLQAQMAGPKGGLGNPGSGNCNNDEIDLRHASPIVLRELDTPPMCALNGAAAGYGLDLTPVS